MSGHPPGTFRLIRRGDSCEHLATDLSPLDRRTLVLSRPDDRAVILGSMQSIDESQKLRLAAEQFSVVRRKSGGGAVVIDPESVVWADFFVPADDPLHLRDLRRGSVWVGELWVEALVSLGSARDLLLVHDAPMISTPWSTICCFAGLGPGEVTIDKRKIIGLSQRRTREGAWYFTLMYNKMDFTRDAHLLCATENEEAGLAAVLQNSVATLGVSIDRVEGALIEALESRYA